MGCHRGASQGAALIWIKTIRWNAIHFDKSRRTLTAQFGYVARSRRRAAITGTE
jgi:hypothetical protein